MLLPNLSEIGIGVIGVLLVLESFPSHLFVIKVTGLDVCLNKKGNGCI